MRYHTYTNNKNLVVVTSTYAGKVVRGVAKCSPNDEFDLEFGTHLAMARVDRKIAELRFKRAKSECKKVMDEINKLELRKDKMENYLENADLELADAIIWLNTLEDHASLPGKLV